jgi:hypothetical protein
VTSASSLPEGAAWGCFMFSNEFARLERRLRLLLALVAGQSVLIEATRTHNARPRRFYFAETASRLPPYNGEVVGPFVGPFVLVFDRMVRAARKHRIRHGVPHPVVAARRRWATLLPEHPSAKAD